MATNTLPLVGANYIRRERLLAMTAEAFAGSSATSFNIYIDVNSMIKCLFQPVFEISMCNNENELAAVLINMIAHYRYIFWSSLRVRTRFFFIYSNNIPTAAKLLYPDWNKNFEEQLRNDYKGKSSFLLKNLTKVKQMIPYITDCAFMTGTYDTTVIMHNVMALEDDGNPNIIITKDLFTMQLAGINKNTVIYRPKKSEGNDVSYVVSPYNNGLYKHYIASKNAQQPVFDVEIAPSLYSFYLALVGGERQVKSITSCTAAAKELLELVKKPNVLNSHNIDISLLVNSLGPKLQGKALRENVFGRFKIIDTVTQSIAYINTAESKMYEGIRNLNDPVGFHTILEDFSNDCPIKVEQL